jgi:Flp pilus assembly protein CpaB
MKKITIYLFTALACVAIAVVGFSVFKVAAMNFAFTEASWGVEEVPVIEEDVVYAATDLEPGDRLSREAMRTERIPLHAAPPGSIRARDLDTLEGLIIKEKIYSGEMIISDRISSSDKIEPIHRAPNSRDSQSSEPAPKLAPPVGGGPPPAAL